jgi:uncharacterized protein YecE (DUF72 family)
VGTSGWQYRDWRGPVYPKHEPVRRWLELYARRFPTVEVNNTFYRLPERSRFEAWAAATPSDFCFAIKASRYLTHIRRLRDPEDAVGRILDASAGLGTKRGPVLVQLPPNLRIDCDALDATLRAFARKVRVAVEFRHQSWDADEVDVVLATHDATRVLADDRGRTTGHRTGSWTYVRLHRGTASPEPCYGRRALSTWAERLADARGYVYFNNDPHGCAVHNAETLCSLIDRPRAPTGPSTSSNGR